MPVPPGSQVDGVYLAEEVGNDAPSYSYSFTTPAARERLGSLFWGPVSRHVKARLPRLKVAVAPYFFDGTSDDGLVRDRKCACAPVPLPWSMGFAPVFAQRPNPLEVAFEYIAIPHHQ